MTDMFLPFSIVRKCVSIFHEQHHHDWHVPTIFDNKNVRIYISWVAQSCLTCPATLGSQQVRIPILFAEPLWLTCSCHIRLLDSAYLYFMSSTIMADMFLPFSIIRMCVFIFHEQHNHGWDVLPLWALSGYIFPFYSRHHHGWHVPAISDYQRVRIYISCATQSWLTTFNCQLVRIPISWAAQSWLTCSCHSWLSGGA